MRKKIAVSAFLILVAVITLSSCGGESEDVPSAPGTQAAYIVVAWNDLGMHCLNPSYDTAVILPPYNMIWAQVIKRGIPPKIVTTGITVE